MVVVVTPGAVLTVGKVSVPATGAVEGRGLADTNPLNSELIPNRSELAEEVKAGAGAAAGAEERDKPRRSHSRAELDTAGAGLGLVSPGRLKVCSEAVINYNNNNLLGTSGRGLEELLETGLEAGADFGGNWSFLNSGFLS